MPIVVKFFANFREATGLGQIEVPIVKDIASLLNVLVERFGSELAEQLYEQGTKKLLDTVNIFVNGRSMNSLEGLATLLKNGDVIAIFPPVSGG